MKIEGIDQLVGAEQLTSLKSKTQVNTDLDFSTWLQKEISVANEQLQSADIKLREYAVGETDNLHQVMTAISKAKTSFNLVLEVRNRMLEGYQEIMRMQM